MTHQKAALPPKLLGTALILLFIGGRAGAGQGAQPLPESESRAVLQQMAQTLAAHATLKARFIQERRLALFDDVLRMKGYFYFQKPGRVRWEFVDPYASILILLEDGRTERFDLAGGKAVRVRTDSSQVSGEVLGQISRWMSGDMGPALPQAQPAIRCVDNRVEPRLRIAVPGLYCIFGAQCRALQPADRTPLQIGLIILPTNQLS